MSDKEYMEHQKIASEFSMLILGKREECECEECLEMRDYYLAYLQMLLARC